MKLLISRGNYARVTQGMSDTQRAEVDAMFEVYPTGVDLVDAVDTGRIADRYLELLAEQQQREAREHAAYACIRRGGCGAHVATWNVPAARPWPLNPDGEPQSHAELVRRWDEIAVAFRARAAGKVRAMQQWADEYERVTGERPSTVGVRRETGPRLPQPWQEMGYGWWVAPMGTPPPEPPGWLDVEHLLGEVSADDVTDTTRRHFLNNQVTGTESDAATAKSPLDDMRAWMRLYENTPPPRAQRLEVGHRALAAIRAVASPARGADKSGAGVLGWLVDMAGIPVVEAGDLPPDAWRLVDAQTGEVLREGRCSSAAQDAIDGSLRAAQEATYELADELGIPRHLFD